MSSVIFTSTDQGNQTLVIITTKTARTHSCFIRKTDDEITLKHARLRRRHLKTELLIKHDSKQNSIKLTEYYYVRS